MATSPTPTPRRLTPTRSDVNRGPKTEPRNLQPYPNRTVHRPGQESVTHHASSQLSRTQTAHPIEFGIATETTRADVRAPDASTLRPPGCALWVETLDVDQAFTASQQSPREIARDAPTSGAFPASRGRSSDDERIGECQQRHCGIRCHVPSYARIRIAGRRVEQQHCRK